MSCFAHVIVHQTAAKDVSESASAWRMEEAFSNLVDGFDTVFATQILRLEGVCLGRFRSKAGECCRPGPIVESPRGTVPFCWSSGEDLGRPNP